MLRVSKHVAFHGCRARFTKRLDAQLIDGCQLPEVTLLVKMHLVFWGIPQQLQC